MSMSGLVLLLAWIMSQALGQNQGEVKECGGMLNSPRGVLQTPEFPRKFPVPIRCRWVIDASQLTNNQHLSIVVYFTQLFVSTGLLFTEFDYYEHDSTFQLGGREIHRVTEQNLTRVDWVRTQRNYLVVDFTLERLEGNHLRVLDDLLDVYGFNITYEVSRVAKHHPCSVSNCSMSGHCFVSHDYREFFCSCFRGFSGSDCSLGPLCQPASNNCENGATCRQVGASASLCHCPEGFTGYKCEVPVSVQDCSEGESCTLQCPEDGTTEPCACGHRGLPPTNDKARYEGTLRLADVSAVRACLESTTCSLKPTLTSQISKYLRNSSLSIMEDLRVLEIGFSGEVHFHFWGGKSDGSKVRESLNRLVQKGWLGDVSLVATHLAITQEPTLHLQKIHFNQPRPQVRQGDEFVIYCIAQGSSHLIFRWFKDGVLVNVTRSKRDMWVRQLPLDSAEQYTALLGVKEADPLDQGTYTCQVSDWGYQQCKSVTLAVLQAPRIRIDPMTVTVEKGENVTVKCMSPNALQFSTKFGYGWTKNHALFKMTPNGEFWEDLYPGGSILQMNNIQKSATYACHVHGSVQTVSRSMRLEVLNQSVVPWCSADESGLGGISWPRTGPGVQARVECPAHYTGVATRLCLLGEEQQAIWQTPDFSDCVSDKINTVANNFHKVTLGFGNTTAMNAVFGILTSLRDRGVVYPGEGEPAISLLHRVTSFLNDSSNLDQLVNSTQYFYSAVNTLLLHRNFVINYQKVEELQQVASTWSGLWGAQSGSGSAHFAFDSLVVDMFRYEEASFREGITLHIPRPTLSYPQWLTSRVTVHVEADRLLQNLSSSVAVVVYHRLAEFLPQRYSQTLENGSEIQFEIASELVSVVARGVRVSSSLELTWNSRSGWELGCGFSDSLSTLWNLTVCHISVLPLNRTLCHCPGSGTFAAVLVKVIHTKERQPRNQSPRIVLMGCACCLVQSLLTLALMSLRWWRHRTCLLFLKIQSCASVVAAMLIFMYSLSRTLPQTYYSPISNSLQAIILISMSSHLSKVLMVYTEIVHMPNVTNLKQTIIAILSGVPLIVVLCNHLAQVSLDLQVVSWWLVRRTAVFYSCLSCGMVLILLFVFLHFHVSKRLKALASFKHIETKKAIHRRLGLLNRACMVFSGTVTMAAASVFYINNPSVKSQYLFSLSCALLGFLLLVSYVLHCESPLHLHMLRTLKLQHVDNGTFSSESDSSPLNIFTKQEAEVDCEGAPPRQTDSKPPLHNGKVEPLRESLCAEPELEVGNSIWSKPTKLELSTVSEKVSQDEQQQQQHQHQQQQVEMEVYGPCSPRQFLQESPEKSTGQQLLLDPGTARVCVITSVVVNTPSVVVCSVDVEPCSVLNKSIVSSQAQPIREVEESKLIPEQKEESESGKESDADVMDRICHDLDYLLGDVKNSSDPDSIPSIMIQNTSL